MSATIHLTSGAALVVDLDVSDVMSKLAASYDELDEDAVVYLRLGDVTVRRDKVAAIEPGAFRRRWITSAAEQNPTNSTDGVGYAPLPIGES